MNEIITDDNERNVDENENVNLVDNDNVIVHVINEIDLDKVSLIGYLICDTLPHLFMRSCAFLRWDDLKEVIYKNLAYYEFVFLNEQSMMTALELGKIIFRDSVMILTNWNDRLGFSLNDMVSQFSWATMFNVPLT